MIYAEYIRRKMHNLSKLNTMSGVPPIAINSAGKNLANYKIYGNMFNQPANIPTPDEPVEWVGVGEKTKNLFDKNTIAVSSALNNGAITSNGSRFVSDYIDCTNLASISINNASSFAWYDENKQVVASENKSEAMFRCYSKPDNAKYVRLDFIKSAITADKVMCVGGTYTEAAMPSYEPYGKYKITIIVSGKNLISTPEFINSVRNTITYENGIWHIVPDETKSPEACVLVNTFNVKAGETITISCKLNHHGYRTNGLRYYDVKTGQSINYIGNCGRGSDMTPSTELTTYSKSYTASKDITIGFNLYAHGFIDEDGDGINDAHPIDFADLQIEYGNTATDYKPYKKTVETNIYLDEPLRKIEGYAADYIDYKRRKVVRNIGLKKVVVSTIYNVTGRNNVYAYMTSSDYLGNANVNNIYNTPNVCDKFRTINGGSISTFDTDDAIACRSRNLYVFIQKSRIANPSEGIDYINNLNANVCYLLSTPVEQDIELPSIPTVKGDCLINIQSGANPSEIEIKYYSR